MLLREKLQETKVLPLSKISHGAGCMERAIHQLKDQTQRGASKISQSFSTQQGLWYSSPANPKWQKITL